MRLRVASALTPLFLLLVAATVATGRASNLPQESDSGPIVFGFATVGGAATAMPVVITNAGGGRLSIEGLALVPTPHGTTRDFTIASDACTGVVLGPRQSCTVKVTFHPAVANSTRVAYLQVLDGLDSCGNFITLAGSASAAAGAAAVAHSSACAIPLSPAKPVSVPQTTACASGQVAAHLTLVRPASIGETNAADRNVTRISVVVNGVATSTISGSHLQGTTVMLHPGARTHYSILIRALTAGGTTYVTPFRYFVTCTAT